MREGAGEHARKANEAVGNAQRNSDEEEEIPDVDNFTDCFEPAEGMRLYLIGEEKRQAAGGHGQREPCL